MQYPTWIRARELDEWAKSPAAKTLLPELIERLVKTTVPRDDLAKCEFHSEAETHRPGYDGTTATRNGTLYVPAGVCYWELGCEARPEQKAQRDYETRVREHEARIAAGETDDISQATFIAVTARDWHTKKPITRKPGKRKTARKAVSKAAPPGEGLTQWAQARSSEQRFKQVIAYDSSGLEQWIREASGVGLWLANQMGKQIAGVVDVDSHWLDVQGALRKPLPPEVLLVNRASIGTAFGEWLAGPAHELAVRAPSALEVVAVFAAWVQTLKQHERNAISSRAIIVEGRDTWRALATSLNPLILIAAPELESDRELFSGAVRKGHFVLRHADTRSPDRGNVIELDRMRRFDLEQALQKAGLEDAEARHIAQGAGGNFTIMRRVFARSPEVQSPGWAKEKVLATLLLAGAWEDERPHDRGIIERLCSTTYDNARAVVAKWRSEPDPPVRLILKNRGVGKTWEFLSPLDAWESLSWELSPLQMNAFEEAAVEVLSEDNPSLSLPPEERPMAAIKGKVQRFSHELRHGIAEMLAIGATREDESEIARDLGFAARARSVVARILPPGCGWQRWASLGQLLSSLVEAAPDTFLTAIENDLASPDPQVLELMRQEIPPSGLGGAVYHSGLLWALETAAWPQEHLSRVALILAQLTERDPGGKWTNRPRASLTRIFFSWRPQTVASVRDRIETLNLVCREAPEAAGSILLSLIPTAFGAFMDSSKPTYRDWAAGWSGGVINADHFAFMDMVSRASVSMTVGQPDRWLQLLDNLAQFHSASPSGYEHIRDTFADFVSRGVSASLKEQLWQKLTEFVQRQTRCRSAEWALPADEVTRWSEFRDALTPNDPVVTLARVFSYAGDVDLDDSLTVEQQAERSGVERRGAVRAIYPSGGVSDINRLARRVQLPWAVGWALAEEFGEEPANQIVPNLLAGGDDQTIQMARGYAGQRIQSADAEWAKTVPQDDWTAEQTASWALQMNFQPDTWDWVAAKGKEEERLYWTWIGSWGGGQLTITDAARAVTHFQQVGRVSDALQFLVSRKDIKHASNADLLCAALEAVVQTPRSRQIGAMDAHYIREALSFLQEKESQADEARVAKLEFAFLPLLDPHFLLPKTLHRQLATDPQFFVDCLKILFRARSPAGDLQDESSEDSEPSEEKSGRAQRIWQLLHDWETIPGADERGVVSTPALRAWLDQARAKAAEAGRLEVADVHIGEVFAKSPEDTDGGLPIVAVRETLEANKSEEIERGFVIGLHNRRGIVSKDLYEGGKQERELARKFEAYAEICSRWPRTAKVLRSVAKGYLREAKEEDERAEARE
jgi:hypothetical protein